MKESEYCDVSNFIRLHEAERIVRGLIPTAHLPKSVIANLAGRLAMLNEEHSVILDSKREEE